MKPPIEAMLMMLPLPCAIIFRPIAWLMKYVPFRLSARMRSYASSVNVLDRRAVRGAGAVDEHVDAPVRLDERVGEGV